MDGSNPKIAQVTVDWQRMPGASWLFEKRVGRRWSLCDGTFADRLAAVCAQLHLDSPCNPWALCPLPPHTYHVTALDGFEHANLGPGRLRTALEAGPACDPDELDEALEKSGVEECELMLADGPVRFEFRALRLWRSSALAAELHPLNAGFDRFLAARERLNVELQRRIGGGAHRPYTPHITLAYCARPERAGVLGDYRLAQWNGLFAEALAGLSVEYTAIGLYVYTDMVSFYRMARRR